MVKAKLVRPENVLAWQLFWEKTTDNKKLAYLKDFFEIHC